MNSIAHYLNQIVFAFQFLNKHEREACNNNKSLLFSLYSRAMIEIVYFFVASYAISNVFINFLQWGQISSYTIGIFLSLIITLLLMDIVAEKRRVVNASKFNFRLLQIIIVFINFAGYTSELPNAYAKDIQNALITKNKQEYSSQINANNASQKQITTWQNERQELIKQKAEIENKIEKNQTLPKNVYKSFYIDDNGKRHNIYVPNQKAINEFNILSQEKKGIDQRLNSYESLLTEKNIAQVKDEQKNLENKVNDLNNAGPIAYFDQLVAIVTTPVGMISVFIGAVMSLLLDIIIVMITSGEITHQALWLRINKAATNESLAALPNSTQKIRFRLLN